MRKIVISIIVILFLTTCDSNKKQQFIGETQGSYYSITYFDPSNRNFSREFDSIFKEVDDAVSLWNENSIISRVNNNDNNVILNQIFIDNFNWAQKASEVSDGVFDATIGPLVEAWGFHNKQGLQMTEAIVDSIKQFVDYRKIRIEDKKIIKNDPRITLDFNAVAQGYTSDLIGSFLISKGVKNFLVDVGGEILVKGNKPNKEYWTIGIERPADNMDSERVIQTRIKLKDKAIVTSGNYRKYIECNGKRYSHNINPKTGYPVEHSLLSVTVLADNSAWADCLASICMIIGKDKSIELIDSLDGIEAYFIYVDDENKIQSCSTEGFFKK